MHEFSENHLKYTFSSEKNSSPIPIVNFRLLFIFMLPLVNISIMINIKYIRNSPLYSTILVTLGFLEKLLGVFWYV